MVELFTEEKQIFFFHRFIHGNDVSFTGVPCFVKTYRTAMLTDVNKYFCSQLFRRN